MTQRVLITGATGFLGHALLRTLKSRGASDVWWMSSSEWGTTEDVHEESRPLPERHEIYRLVEDINPDFIFHLATVFRAQHAPNDVARIIEANLAFGGQILEGGAGAGASILITSSAWQSQNFREPPLSLYSATKEAFSRLVDFYAEHQSIDVKEVFLGDTYGPGDSRGKIVDLLLRAAREDLAITLGSPHKLISLSYVDDVVEDLLWIRDQPSRRDWSIQSSEVVSLEELVSIVQEVTSTKLRVTWTSQMDRPTDHAFLKTARRSVDRKHNVSLAQGLAATWDIDN